MSQIQNLVLANGQDTPVDQTFSPVNPQYGSTPAKWYNKVTSLFSGYTEATQLLTRKGTSQRFSVKVRVPYLNDDGSLRAQNLFTANFIIADACTEDERKDILAYAQGMFADATVVSAVVDNEPTF